MQPLRVKTVCHCWQPASRTRFKDILRQETINKFPTLVALVIQEHVLILGNRLSFNLMQSCWWVLSLCLQGTCERHISDLMLGGADSMVPTLWSRTLPTILLMDANLMHVMGVHVRNALLENWEIWLYRAIQADVMKTFATLNGELILY